MSEQVFLFLQSHPSFFGKTLVRQMRKDGATCHLINVSLGDWLFRFGTGAKNYCGKLRDWHRFLDQFISDHKVTDIVYYADQRPYNRIARSIAYQRSLTTYAYEFGYLRPDWITLEKGGMGAFSHFPNDPDVIRELAAKVKTPQVTGKYTYPFYLEATCEVVYHMIPTFLPYLFPHYRRDRYYHPWIEFPSFIPRLLRSKRNNRHANEQINKLIDEKRDFFVVPMQLQSDYQIRRASHYTHIGEMVDEVLHSFKTYAKRNAKLIFKIHPLDNNIEKWPCVIKKIATDHDLLDRIYVIDGGDLHKLIRHSKGVVLINSTTGIKVLQFGVSLKVLGIAIFDVPGMTHQDSLDTFWISPHKPDKQLTDDFLKLMTVSVQVRGNFFTSAGRAIAAKEISRRLRHGDVNSYGAYLSPPPRLEKAKAMNVPMIHEDLDY